MRSNAVDFMSEENEDFTYMPRMPRDADEWFGWGINFGFLALIAKNLVYWLGRIIYTPLVSGDTSDINAFAVARIANDFTQNTLYFLVIALWHTFCYTSPKKGRIYGFWKSRVWGQLLMPGGFAPRPAAMSVGAVLFIAQTIVFEQVVSGQMLAQKWDDWDACRAINLDLAPSKRTWFPRLHRLGPITMDGWSFRCFGVESLGLGGLASTAFEFHEDSVFNFTQNLGPENFTNASEVVHPYTDDVIRSSDLVYQFTDHTGHLMMRNCEYQCVKWRSVGVNDLIKNLGMILTGAAIVVKITETLSNIIGTTFLDADTEADDFAKLVLKTTRRRSFLGCLRYKKSICAIQLAALGMTPLFVAPRLDIDGYYTVDYYVTSVLLCSVSVAVMIRSWSPFSFGMVLYTKRLWQDGEDEFLKLAPPNRPEKVKIDLYQWIHLTNAARFNHLHLYCRQAVMSEVESELARQRKKYEEAPSHIDLMDDEEAMKVMCIDAINHARYQSVKKGYLKKIEVKVDGGTQGVIVSKNPDGSVNVAWECVFITVREEGEDSTREAKGDKMETTPAHLVNLLESTAAWELTIDTLQQEDVNIRRIQDLIADAGKIVV